ncbi:LysR family transcriptional regulator [Pseudomonas yamanorum]|uniref:LysR family transcriptional regulator n=1 Tax=Pseudomonas yamanorum TaxID=515393 RepID=UPI0015A233FF|nr:LysR family transcriptional regulator [Pseudomonas yamanorum]NWD23598.1 LysR family transcriptional regulator [Pseudomonas yamanorum]
MDRLIWRDLALFEVVARHQSFTAAAAELAMSQSTLSYTIGQLEKRLGLALLARTTRSVAPTEAGRRLMQSLVPALNDLTDELDKLRAMGTDISGTVRLTMIPVAYETLVRPMLLDFLTRHANISFEVSTNEGLNDIVADGFDGGIRFGAIIEKDMVAIPLTASSSVTIVGAPGYFERHGSKPRTPEELSEHRCIFYRFVGSKRLSPWPLRKGERSVDFSANGPLVLNDGAAIRTAALDGLGLAYLFRSQVSSDLAQGALIEVLSDWVPDTSGFSLYYPNRRRVSPAFRAFIDEICMHAKK